MEKTKVTTTGAVLTAIIASLCCIGPIAVATIGVGSIAAFSVFWEYRPYFIGLTAVLLGFAFYLTYRKREVACEDGTCKTESASRWSKMTVWFVALLAALAVAFPYITVTHAQEDDPSAISAASVVLKIDGMDCKGCAAGLEATLAHTKGIHKAKVLFDEGKGVVKYDPEVIQPEQIVELVDETGFTATLVNQTESL
jgi:mercuric ion transport protein